MSSCNVLELGGKESSDWVGLGKIDEKPLKGK